MDIKAFRGLSGTYNVSANERDCGNPSQRLECIVYFLNNTQQKFILDRSSKGQALLDKVFKHLNLIETDLFGLKFFPDSQERTYNSSAINKSSISLSLSISSNNNLGCFQTQDNSIRSNKSDNHIKKNNGSIDHDFDHPHEDRSNKTVQSSNFRSANHTGNGSPSSPEDSDSQINKKTGSDSQRQSPTYLNDHSCNNYDCNNSSQKKNHARNMSELLSSDKLNLARWLDPSKSIKKQIKVGPPFRFYFRVKFYVTDPCRLADDKTKNYLYQQLRFDIFNDRLIVPTCSAILLASYILQSDLGDYNHEFLEDTFTTNNCLLSNQSDDFKRKVIELHKQHKSLSPADAEHNFLEHASKKLDCYGVEFYDAQDILKTDVRIGVSSNGIIVFQNHLKTNQFSWAKILKIMFKKKIFSIQLRRDSDRGNLCDDLIEFNLLTNQLCKSFWEECVAQHSFFRLHQPKSPPKKFFSFLNFGSKFQYNGKTEYQTMEESKKRSFSHFSRSPSKRYARFTIPIGRPSWSNSNNISQESPESENQHSHEEAEPINLKESIRIIKQGLSSKKLIEDFERLSRKREDESLDESRSMENMDKNRYQDILPYDSTRVQLIDSMTGDYINASFVNMTVPSRNINRYIATQGPLASTCDDFWQMIWEQNSSLIIMVTPLIEGGRIKCHKYWPDEREEVRHGQIIVKNLNEKSKVATIDRAIQLVDVKSGEKKMTTQIQYRAWPDHEVPVDCSDFLKLVYRVRKHRRSHPDDPIVVHCSAGIGRTGVLILMETAVCFMEAGEPINPIKILEDMRSQRAMLIQTNSQFQFVTDAICKVYDQKSLKKPMKNKTRSNSK